MGVMTVHELSQDTSGAIDRVEAREEIQVTKNGKLVAIIVPVTDEQLIPLRRTRVVPRKQFPGVSADAPIMDAARFRADVDSAMDGRLQDPYEA